MENNGGNNTDNWDDDDFDGTKRFGDRAEFVMKIGGDIFRNGARLVFKCCECEKLFTIGSDHVPLRMGIYTYGAREQHELMAEAEVRILSRLMKTLGTCVCDYHPPAHRFLLGWPW